MENYSAGPASSTVNSGKYVYLCIKSGFSISTALMYFDPSIPRNLEISTWKLKKKSEREKAPLPISNSYLPPCPCLLIEKRMKSWFIFGSAIFRRQQKVDLEHDTWTNKLLYDAIFLSSIWSQWSHTRNWSKRIFWKV